MSKLNMNWSDRFTLIDHYKPSDDQILGVFGLTQDELDTARVMRQAGTFVANSKLDIAKVGNVFASGQRLPSAVPVTLAGGQPMTISTSVSPTGGARTTKLITATSHLKPETATKKARVPQKRGRKGDKIQQALASVPTSPTPVDDFIKQYGVSLPVLRQSKRFIEKMPADQVASIGKINVRQDKATKVLMIWREVAAKA